MKVWWQALSKYGKIFDNGEKWNNVEYYNMSYDEQYKPKKYLHISHLHSTFPQSLHSIMVILLMDALQPKQIVELLSKYWNSIVVTSPATQPLYTVSELQSQTKQ